jgi:hypothetical protein
MALKDWFRMAERQTLARFEHWTEAQDLVRQMKAELGRRQKYVFFVLRNGAAHRCVMLSKDRIKVWEPYLDQVSKLGWVPDPDCVVRASASEKRPRSADYVSRKKKSRELTLEEVFLE